MDAELTSTDYAVLILLRTEGRELSNKEMDELYRVKLLKGAYEALNAAGYIVSDTKRRPYRHVITKEGRKALADPLKIEDDVAEDGEKRSFKEKALWAALVAQQNEGRRPPATAKGSTGPDDAPVAIEVPADLQERVRAAYTQLAGSPGKWVSLTDLRPLFGDVSKAELDKALLGLLDATDVRLEPEPFGHRIGAAEREAAVHVGGEDRHKLAIGLP